MYLENKLKDKNGIQLNGVDIDLTEVNTPSYFLSAAQDHIAKWKSTYSGATLFKGDVKFVLGGSGHIAGVVNPPAANKYGYWTNDDLPKDSEQWFQGAEKHKGSWWTDWQAWVGPYADKKVSARTCTNSLESAPGAYVNKRIIDVIAQ